MHVLSALCKFDQTETVRQQRRSAVRAQPQHLSWRSVSALVIQLQNFAKNCKVRFLRRATFKDLCLPPCLSKLVSSSRRNGQVRNAATATAVGMRLKCQCTMSSATSGSEHGARLCKRAIVGNEAKASWIRFTKHSVSH